MFLLFENVIGYSVFECLEGFTMDLNYPRFQDFISLYSNFCNNFRLKAFIPFDSLEHSLQNCGCISNGISTAFLSEFLLNLNKENNKKISFGIIDPKLGTYIKQKSKIPTISNEIVTEFSRAIRLHTEKISKNFFYREIKKAQCGIAHLYSQSKMKLDLRKTDNMIIQSSLLLEQFDKDINFFSMILREWYSWYFPELGKILPDNYLFSLVIKFIRNKTTFSKKNFRELKILVMSEPTSNEILEATKNSIGSAASKIDLNIVEKLCSCIILMSEFRDRLILYLHKKVDIIAPNLKALVGENLSAKLISKAGSFKNLAKYPASTVQILGSEKALFRSLKNKTKTPKFGILFNSGFISKTKFKNRGKMSRFLSNKCTLAIRIDYFSPLSSAFYGKKFKEQLESKFEDLNQV